MEIGKDQDGLKNIMPQLAERVTTQMPCGGRGRATNDFEKMGRKQFPGVFMEHFPNQNVSVLFFFFFFSK